MAYEKRMADQVILKRHVNNVAIEGLELIVVLIVKNLTKSFSFGFASRCI